MQRGSWEGGGRWEGEIIAGGVVRSVGGCVFGVCLGHWTIDHTCITFDTEHLGTEERMNPAVKFGRYPFY